MGIGIIPSAMRLAGYEESIIEKVKAMVDRNNKKEDNPIQKHNSRGMSKYQVGKEPYLIGFEEK